MSVKFTTNLQEDWLTVFRQYKAMAEGAMSQVSDEEFFRAIDSESNSIAVIVKHMAGNMRSRWADFLTSDGEKPWRNRDTEFEDSGNLTRAQLLEHWEAGWRLVFSALEPLADTDLGRAITIRGEKHSVIQAVNRQIAHYASHIGQIIFLSKHFRFADWKTLSIPRNKSAEFNRSMESRKQG